MVNWLPQKIAGRLEKEMSALSLLAGRGIHLGNRSYRAAGGYRNRVALDNRHEYWIDATIRAALAAKPGVFVDVGANAGQTLMKLLSYEDGRAYVGFEPQVDCAFFVTDFIARNGLHNCSLLPIGLSNRTGVVELLKRADHVDAAASTVAGFRPDDFYASRQPIYVVTGDEALRALGVDDVSIIKVDVEGGELEVIEGLQGTLAAASPTVLFEVLNHFLVVTGSELTSDAIALREERTRGLEAILRRLGYGIFNIRPDRTLAEIAEIRQTVSRDLKITDYVAIHGDWRDAFLRNFDGSVVQG